MFSNTAYEALYQLIGLGLHSKFIEVITGESFFKGLILMIFGGVLFFTLLKYISRFVPGSLIERKQIPLSRFVKMVACLFLGLAILRVGTEASVKDFQGKNWAENRYVQGNLQKVENQYRVSVVFSLISRTAEELTSLLARVIDQVFEKGNSQLTSPNIFYKAIMYAGVTSIEDPELRDQLRFYSDECFTKIMPLVDQVKNQKFSDGFFSKSDRLDHELAEVKIDLGQGKTTDCLEVKQSTVSKMTAYSKSKVSDFYSHMPSYVDPTNGIIIDQNNEFDENYTASMALANYYADQSEGRLGIQKGAEVQGIAGGIFQTLGRIVGWDGILGTFGHRELQGASEAAERSQAFSEHLARAPHVAGFIRMLLTAAFPWLMFFVVAGKWRVLVIWFWVYFSVLMWTPLWTLLYHIMLGISLSGEVMQLFGDLSKDGVSTYAATVINHRMYYMFSIYAWLQLLVATLTTGAVFVFIKPMLGERSEESKPEFIDPAVSTGKVVAGAVL